MEELDGFRDEEEEEEEEEGLGFFLGRIAFRLGLFSLHFSASSVSATPQRERVSVCVCVSLLVLCCLCDFIAFLLFGIWDFPPKYYSKFPK